MSADISIETEASVAHPAAGVVARRSQFHLVEWESPSGGGKAELVILSGVTAPESPRRVARIEVDADGGPPRAYSPEGALLTLPSPEEVRAMLGPPPASRAPGVTRGPAPPPAVAGYARRPGLLVGLFVDSAEGAALRSRLLARYGEPALTASGEETFGEASAGTVRSVTYDPRIGSLSGLEVTAGGRLLMRLRYVFSELAPGRSGRSAQVVEREIPGAAGSTRIARTTFRVKNVEAAQ